MATGNLEVVDYSFSRINLAQAKAAGVKGCMRYLYRSGKGLTASEVAQFRTAGVALGLNYEAGAGDFTGYNAGRAQALTAEDIAVNLGLGGHTIAFSADWPVTLPQYKAVGDAVQGALDVLGDGRVGCYGHAGLIDYLFARFGTRIYYWQTYAWSNGRVSAHADLYQYLNGQNFAGGQVDFNDIRGRTFWAIDSSGHTVSGGGTQLEEDDVTPEDMAKINAMIADVGGQEIARLDTIIALLKGTDSDKALVRNVWLNAQATNAVTGKSQDALSFLAFVAPLAQMVAGKPATTGGSEVDAAELATQIVAQLGPEFATQLASKLTLTATVHGSPA